VWKRIGARYATGKPRSLGVRDRCATSMTLWPYVAKDVSTVEALASLNAICAQPTEA